MALAITPDDLLGTVVAMGGLAIAAGVVAWMLVARDPIRDWRGVPD